MSQTNSPPASTLKRVDLLILGLGWTSQFLLPLLSEQRISHAGSTRDGRDDSIPFNFDAASDSPDNPASIQKFSGLPDAATVLITFPLKGRESVRTFLALWTSTHNISHHGRANWIQLGSTGIYTGDGCHDESSPIDRYSERGLAEDELL